MNSGKGLRWHLNYLKKQTIKQKLDYIHYNPVMKKWGALQRPVRLLLLFISYFL